MSLSEFLTVINVEKFSSWIRLKRATAYVLRVLYVSLWNKLDEPPKSKYERLSKLFRYCKVNGRLTCKELNSAEILLLESDQCRHFRQLIFSLQNNTKNELRETLGIIVKDNLLRCEGRYSKMNLSDNEKFPILLSNKSSISKLLVQYAHGKVLHSGVQSTLIELKKSYWIPKGRLLVRKIIKKCLVCKRCQVEPYKLPPMPPLPSFRSNRTNPFQIIGSDYFGPISIRKDLTNERVKTWVCLFTCITTRAIHLEVVTNLSI